MDLVCSLDVVVLVASYVLRMSYPVNCIYPLPCNNRMLGYVCCVLGSVDRVSRLSGIYPDSLWRYAVVRDAFL